MDGGNIKDLLSVPMTSKVHLLVWEDMPRVFECGVFSKGMLRAGTFDVRQVTCKACLKKFAANRGARVPRPRRRDGQLSLAPCPCSGWFENVQAGLDPCAGCGWR